MTRNIVAKIDLILHATEDFQKIAEPLNDLFVIEKEDVTKQELSGHFGNPILMLHVEVKKKRADQFIKKLVSLITRDTMNELLTNIEEQIFESSMYIRFSKQSLVKKFWHLKRRILLELQFTHQYM